MAKRKRLTPANPGYLDGAAPETKSMFARSAPIADVAAEASTVAALDEMADTLAEARKNGRMVLSLPLAAIQMDYLVRDRIVIDDDDMATLTESLRLRGQQTPIEVTDLGGGRYGLISGWRRCQALLHLAAEEDAFDHVLALLRRPDQSSEAYIAMVEENEIRADLNHYERARIVVKTVDQGVFETKKAALTALFAAVARSKRSKIGSFVTVVEALDGALRFPAAISERLGLQLAKALQDTPGLAAQLRRKLSALKHPDAAAETALLTAALAPEKPAKPTPPAPRVDRIHPDLTLIQNPDGSLLLQGARADDTLRQQLKQWLTARL